VHTDVVKDSQREDPSKVRRSPRIRLQMPVFLRATDNSGAEFIELTKTLNISTTGACVASTHLLRRDQIVHLTIPAPPSARQRCCGKRRRETYGSLDWNS
jgi:hypothetical protein